MPTKHLKAYVYRFPLIKLRHNADNLTIGLDEIDDCQEYESCIYDAAWTYNQTTPLEDMSWGAPNLFKCMGYTHVNGVATSKLEKLVVGAIYSEYRSKPEDVDYLQRHRLPGYHAVSNGYHGQFEAACLEAMQLLPIKPLSAIGGYSN